LIATEFPGQFPGKELYNLDIRDEYFFAKEARKRRILRKVELLNSIRMATWSDKNSFANKIYELEEEFNELAGITDEVVKDNWQSLKAKKRG